MTESDEFGGAKKKTNTKSTDLDQKLSLMNEIEIMISKSVEKVFEDHMKKFMNDFAKQSNILQKPCAAPRQENIAQARENASKSFELPKDRKTISAGPYDIFSENSSFAQRDPLNHAQGASSIQAQAQGVNPQIDTNALILKLLQGDREERNERKFERELNKIPEFSGDSKKNLDRFVTASSIVYHKIRTEEQSNSFYDEILRKTSGSALATVERMVGMRWIDIESALRRRFAYLTVNSDVLRSKIEALKQNKNENIHDFSKRTRTLVNERIKSYDVITTDLEREIEKSALKCFQRGITNEKVRDRVINMGASTLDGAFQNALEVEADMSFEVNKRDFYCKICSITGHKTSDCKKNDQSEMARFTSALEKLVNVKQKRYDFNKQSNTNSNFWNKSESNQGNWRKNGNQTKINSNNGSKNDQKAIHFVQDESNEISKEDMIDEERSNQSDSSENSDE